MEEIFNKIFFDINMIPVEAKITNDFSVSEFPFIVSKSKT